MFNRATAARIKELEYALIDARNGLAGALRLQRERAALISAVRNGRYITLTFVRNGELTSVEFYATTDVDINALNKTLLGKSDTE